MKNALFCHLKIKPLVFISNTRGFSGVGEIIELTFLHKRTTITHHPIKCGSVFNNS